MKEVNGVDVSGKVSPSEKSIVSTISAVKLVEEGDFLFPARRGMLIQRESSREVDGEV